jgi:hypothetical protein
MLNEYMEGARLDLDNVRDAQNFSKATMVVEDFDLDEVLSQPNVPSAVQHDSIKAVGLDEKPVNGSNGLNKEPPAKSNAKSIASAIRSAVKSARRSEKPVTPREVSARISSRIASARQAGPARSEVSVSPSEVRITPRNRNISERSVAGSDIRLGRSERDEPSGRREENEWGEQRKSSAVKERPRRDEMGWRDDKEKRRDERDLFPPHRVDSDKKPIQSGIKIPEPEMSERAKAQMKEDEEVHEEIDMMPRTADEKHLYWKTRLQILKTRFTDVTIPKNCADMPWESLRKIYYIEMDRVSISKNVEGYKMIMIVMFFILEYVGARFLKINITGFTVHSLRTMHRYERLLIELGEKDYGSFASNLPVEVRLCGLVMVNAVIFVIAKYVFKVTNQDASDEFFDLFQNLGNATVEADLGENAGMEAPAPGSDGGNNGILGMLGGLLGNLTGGQGGGGGGLGGLFSAFTGGGNAAPAAKDEGGKTGDDDENRIKPPTFRRKKKKKAEES